MKNEAAMALGRLGGLKGGKARTERKVSASKANGKLGGRPLGGRKPVQPLTPPPPAVQAMAECIAKLPLAAARQPTKSQPKPEPKKSKSSPSAEPAWCARHQLMVVRDGKCLRCLRG